MRYRIAFSMVVMWMSAGLLQGQVPQVPPSVYTGSIGGGFALTGGNTDTQTFNLSGAFVRDPQTRNLLRAKASYLRGNQDETLNLDRTTVNLRDEFTISGRTFAFGQMDYVRNPFKGIIFLWAPTGGIGHKLIDRESTSLTFDAGAGGIIEKNPGPAADKSGSLTASETFRQELSDIATLTQSIATIWKTQDFGDSLTNAAVGITTSLVGNLELKVELLDTYKNKPANPSLRKSDTAFTTAFVWSF